MPNNHRQNPIEANPQQTGLSFGLSEMQDDIVMEHNTYVDTVDNAIGADEQAAINHIYGGAATGAAGTGALLRYTKLRRQAHTLNTLVANEDAFLNTFEQKWRTFTTEIPEADVPEPKKPTILNSPRATRKDEFLTVEKLKAAGITELDNGQPIDWAQYKVSKTGKPLNRYSELLHEQVEAQRQTNIKYNNGTGPGSLQQDQLEYDAAEARHKAEMRRVRAENIQRTRQRGIRDTVLGTDGKGAGADPVIHGKRQAYDAALSDYKSKTSGSGALPPNHPDVLAARQTLLTASDELGEAITKNETVQRNFHRLSTRGRVAAFDDVAEQLRGRAAHHAAARKILGTTTKLGIPEGSLHTALSEARAGVRNLSEAASELETGKRTTLNIEKYFKANGTLRTAGRRVLASAGVAGMAITPAMLIYGTGSYTLNWNTDDKKHAATLQKMDEKIFLKDKLGKTVTATYTSDEEVQAAAQALLEMATDPKDRAILQHVADGGNVYDYLSTLPEGEGLRTPTNEYTKEILDPEERRKNVHTSFANHIMAQHRQLQQNGLNGENDGPEIAGMDDIPEPAPEPTPEPEQTPEPALISDDVKWAALDPDEVAKMDEKALNTAFALGQKWTAAHAELEKKARQLKREIKKLDDEIAKMPDGPEKEAKKAERSVKQGNLDTFTQQVKVAEANIELLNNRRAVLDKGLPPNPEHIPVITPVNTIPPGTIIGPDGQPLTQQQQQVQQQQPQKGFWGRAWDWIKRNWGWLLAGALAIGGAVWGGIALFKKKKSNSTTTTTTNKTTTNTTTKTTTNSSTGNTSNTSSGNSTLAQAAAAGAVITGTNVSVATKTADVSGINGQNITVASQTNTSSGNSNNR